MPTAYNQAKTDFYNKYKTQIDGISQKQGVDTGVGTDMFLSNAQGKSNYSGGGVFDFSKATADVQNLRNLANQNIGPTATAQQTPDSQSQINSIYDQQKASQLSALKAQRDQAGGLINQQKAELAPQYQNMRNQSDVVNAQNVKKLSELIANAGLTASGDNVTAQVGLANERQNALSSLNTQEQQQVNDYNRRLADLYNPAQEQSILSQIEAARAQALYNGGIDQRNFDYQNKQADRSFGIQEGQLLGMYNGAPTLQKQQMNDQNAQFDKTFGLQVGQTLGNYNGLPTLGQKELDSNNAHRAQQAAAAQAARTVKNANNQEPTVNEVYDSLVSSGVPQDQILPYLRQNKATPQAINEMAAFIQRIMQGGPLQGPPVPEQQPAGTNPNWVNDQGFYFPPF